MSRATADPAMSGPTQVALGDVLAGRRGGLSGIILFAGPAVVASIAYMDPGNFATNIQAGAGFGYSLLWVVLFANLVAMLFQALSAKLGIVTGRNLAEICRDQLPAPLVLVLWVVSELAAMATDLAEFLGGAIAISLLLHLPLMVGMIIVAIATYALLLVERRGFRSVEMAIGSLVGVIVLCYVAELLIASIDWRAAGIGFMVPVLPNGEALLIATGIIGATVMPHALFLHSGLTQGRAPTRSDEERARVLRFSNWEVIVALGIAGLVNAAMVMTAAAAFHPAHSDIATIETAYRTLMPLLGPAAAGVFLVSLLASGLSSSAVGTLAGQMIMQGFVRMRIPLVVRRIVTMAPAFVVVALGVAPTPALVMSQVVLSFALPVPMIALVVFTGRRDIMGRFANGRLVQALAVAATAVVVALNFVLVVQALGLA